MSPRGGGGSSSAGGGRSSVSSSSGTRGGSLSGSSGTSGTSPYSGGSRGSSGPKPPSYSSGSNGGGGSKSPSYVGGVYGGSGSTRPMGGSARNSCHDIDDEDDDACTYTSAAIPSKNNPFSFLSKRARVQPHGQSRIFTEYSKEPSAAFEDSLLFDSHGAGVIPFWSTAQKTPEYDSSSLCQKPYKSKSETFARGVASDPFTFFLLAALMFLLGSMISDSFENQKTSKREKKAKKYAKRVDDLYIKGIMGQHIEHAESLEKEAVHAKGMVGP
ncbi:MAG: hypothetical protein Q9204_002185 [Flavoplaca sp. TL-2023a]